MTSLLVTLIIITILVTLNVGDIAYNEVYLGLILLITVNENIC